MQKSDSFEGGSQTRFARKTDSIHIFATISHMGRGGNRCFSIATAQSAVTSDVRENGRHIRNLMSSASEERLVADAEAGRVKPAGDVFDRLEKKYKAVSSK